MTIQGATPNSASSDDVGRTLFVTRYLVPGVVATSLITIASIGVGWIPLSSELLNLSFVDSLRTNPIGVAIARLMLIAGGALLLQTWLVLGADLLSGLTQSLRRLWILLAAWTVPLIIAAPLFSRDVFSYFAQGKLVAAGIDPYTNGVSAVPGWFNDGVDPMWAEAPTPYGPFFLMIERGVATLVPQHALTGAILLRLTSIAGVALLAWFLPRLAFLHGIDGSKALWLGVLNPLVLMHFVAGAHNDALMLGLMVAGITLAAEGKPIPGIALVALAGSVKPIALLALPFVGLLWAGTRATWPRRIGTWAASGALAAAITVGLGAMIGVGLGWVSALTTPGTVRTWLSPTTAIGMALGWLVNALGLGDHTDLLVAVFRAIGMLIAVAYVARLLLRPQGRTPVRATALAFTAVILLGPVIQAWYLLWALPLVAATGLRKPWHLRAVILGSAAFVIYGLAESSATSSSFLQLQDGLAMVFAAGAIAFVALASPRERELVLGNQYAHGLTPDDQPAKTRSRQLVFVGPTALSATDS